MRFSMLPTASGALLLSIVVGCGGSNQHSSTPATPVLTQLHTITTIGSTVDTQNGDSNPYGLAIAPMTTGYVAAGDLLVCNFNDKSGDAGYGTTIEDLSPMAGAMPKRIAEDPSLKGCAALASDPTNGYIWAAAYTANDVPEFTASGKLMSTVSSQWMYPWGEIDATPEMTAYSGTTSPAFYITNAKSGTLDRVAITSGGTTVTEIASGFPVDLTSQYGVLAPAGLTYNPQTDTLYVVSSQDNSVVAIANVSSVPEDGITVTASMGSMTSDTGYGATSATLTFSGPAASQASVVYSGTPLNYPVSAALLYNGNLVVGNTGDNNLVEIDPAQKTMVGEKLVDNGNAGAIFGIASTGTTAATQKIYFNDDNTNSVVSVSQ
jgi:hypothetical protein